MTHVGIVVKGIVQGVGMRPFVFGLARELGLEGRVANETDGVRIELAGEADAIAAFENALVTRAPSLARIDRVERFAVDADRRWGEFVIETSRAGEGTHAFVTPDAATCDACKDEIFDRDDRRFGHAFASCTNCGPRLTIVRALPWDRDTTTMAAFPMCAACRAEYEDPSDRRFHAQPIACPACGPTLSAHISDVAAALARGEIVALKGLGGYHLACDARSERAVTELRARKRRDAKPFAIMVADADVAGELVHLDAEARALLASKERPIVLLLRRADARLASGIAPGLDRLGVMLPYTPLHHLLLRLTGPLVMTSGNVSDEPIAYDDEDARTRLAPLAELFVTHDRPIAMRVDDSVAHVIDGAPAILRRARGHAPASIALPHALSRPTLALGGHLKAAFALGRDRDAFLSQHIGDLDHVEAWRSFREARVRYEELLRIAPEFVVHDLHPDYATTALAEELDLPRLGVQHHEAHVAGALAEHGITEPAIGVAFDGAGWGTDGTIWGGEIFTGTIGDLRRRARLRPVALPGGDRAAREPWRMAISYRFDAGEAVEDNAIASLLPRAIKTSSMGRLFDAAASLLGVRRVNEFEAQAAMELQARAEAMGQGTPLPFELSERDGLLEMDPRPLVRALARGEGDAYRFHATIAAMTADACRALRNEAKVVVLSGGVFANALLVRLLAQRLRAERFRVFVQRKVPTNDGGLAYGQLAIVAARGA